MFVLTQSQQCHPHERTACQAEEVPYLLPGQPPYFGLTRLCGKPTQLSQWQVEPPDRFDHLHRLAFMRAKDGTQALVSPRQLLHPLLQCGDIYPPAQPHGSGDVVDWTARLQLVEEPQTLLSKGQR